jgi:hypothetical protein
MEPRDRSERFHDPWDASCGNQPADFHCKDKSEQFFNRLSLIDDKSWPTGAVKVGQIKRHAQTPIKCGLEILRREGRRRGGRENGGDSSVPSVSSFPPCQPEDTHVCFARVKHSGIFGASGSVGQDQQAVPGPGTGTIVDRNGEQTPLVKPRTYFVQSDPRPVSSTATGQKK